MDKKQSTPNQVKFNANKNKQHMAADTKQRNSGQNFNRGKQ